MCIRDSIDGDAPIFVVARAPYAEAIFNENQFKDVEDSSSTSYKGYNKLKRDLENKKQNELRKKTEILQKIDVFFKAQEFEIMFTRNTFPKFLDKVKDNDYIIYVEGAIFEHTDRRVRTEDRVRYSESNPFKN